MDFFINLLNSVQKGRVTGLYVNRGGWDVKKIV